MKQSRPRAASAASPINRLVEINENSPERTSQSARDVKRWARLERFRLTREIPKAEQAPFRALLFGHDKLVTADVEGRALPAIRRFHLDQARTTIRSETGNIVAGTITIPSQAAAFSLQITPELEAEIDRLAQGYVTAGMAAHEAADKLDRIKAQSERGKDALQDMFGSIIDGSISAKDAVKQLLLEIVKAQALRGIMSLPGMGGLASAVGGLLIPKYAAGGDHGGGLWIVGERGAELEATGPAQIWTAEKTRKMLNPDLGDCPHGRQIWAEMRNIAG